MKISKDNVRDIFYYDALTGEFKWKSSLNKKFKDGDKAGHVRPDGYVHIGYGNEEYQAHRLAWLFVYGDWPSKIIDHIDGNPSNNSIENLRDVTQFQNSQNRRKHSKNNKLSLLGVSFDPRFEKFRATIKHSGKCITIGRYDTPEEANKEYIKAKAKYHSHSTLWVI